MDALIPWSGLLSVIEPHYPKAGRRGRQPMGLETMLRIYFMQQWYALSDPAMEDALLEIESMRRFAHLVWNCNQSSVSSRSQRSTTAPACRAYQIPCRQPG
jgi:hypothetical protein